MMNCGPYIIEGVWKPDLYSLLRIRFMIATVVKAVQRYPYGSISALNGVPSDSRGM